MPHKRESSHQKADQSTRPNIKPADIVQNEMVLDPRELLTREFDDLTPGEANQLQRTIGNQALQNLSIQRKMSDGSVCDDYKQETNSAVEQIVGQINSPALPTTQRQEEEKLQTKRDPMLLGEGMSQDIFFRGGEYNPDSTVRKKPLAHEPAQSIHHGGTSSIQPNLQQPINQIQRWGKKSTPPPAQVLKRSDHQGQLDTIASAIVPKLAAEGKLKVLNYLAGGLGKGGAHFWRSKELRAFRAKMKAAARTQAYGDIIGLMAEDEVFDDSELEVGPAMKDHIEVVAKNEAYHGAKKVVDNTVQQIAEDWIARAWADDAILEEANQAAIEAAWKVYRENPNPKTWKAAQKAAGQAAKKSIDAQVKTHLALAKSAKNEVLKPKEDQRVGAAEDQQKIASMVAENASDLGLKSIQHAIKCNTTDEGLGIVGKLLDQVIPLPGEQVSLDVSLQIPTGDGVSYVVLKLMGKAGRGITGFSTSGVTTLGNPKRLEVMAQFSIGAGAETFGLKAEASVGFFTRAGSDQGTAATMKALSYGGYRAASGINSHFGDWWAGGGKGSLLSKEERAEKWAAAIEEQVFMESDDEDAENKNAFADVGGSLSGSGGIKVADVFSAELGLGGEVFKRYDADALKSSLDSDASNPLFGQPVQSPEQARQRRKKAKGRTTSSFGASASVEVAINNQGVAFNGSISMENDFDQNVARDNWGVEISAEISAGTDPLSKLEQIAAGIVTGSLSIAQNLAAIIKKQKAGPGIDILADITQITNAGLSNQITSGLAEAWAVDGSKFDMGIGASGVPDAASGIGAKSAIQVAITFGKSGGKGVFRFEIRDSKGIDIAVGMGSVGLSVSAAKGKRILAIGYEDGGFAAEAIGLRAPKKK